MRFAVHLAFLAAWLVAATGHAETQEWQARSYVKSAFITGAAAAILDEHVVVGDRLRARLSLAADANGPKVYEALFALTDEKPFKVRPATADEARNFVARRQPVIALETGDVTVLMQYDLEQNNVVRVALPAAAAAGGSAAEAPRLLAVASAPVAMPSREPIVLRLTPLSFGFDSASVTNEARAQLESEGLPKLVDIASARFTIAGYADRLGPAEYNQRLSERRAEAVRSYLVAKGVDAGSIRVIGFGSAQPTTQCPDQRDRKALIACLAPDRRVTVEIEPSAL